LVTGKQNSRRYDSGSGRPIDLSSPEKKEESTDPGRESRGESGDEGGDRAMNERRNSDQPEKKGRFIEIDFTIVTGNDPVARTDHLPGHLGIPEIIMVFEASVPEIEKEEEAGSDDKPSCNPTLTLSPVIHIRPFDRINKRRWPGLLFYQ
jgi:hypothetical protein